MLIYDLRQIGGKMLLLRKRLGLTQGELAEIAGLSDRTYADIERGSANMRIETALKISDSLHVTPNDLFTEEEPPQELLQSELIGRLNTCTTEQKQTALSLLKVYLDSVQGL